MGDFVREDGDELATPVPGGVGLINEELRKWERVRGIKFVINLARVFVIWIKNWFRENFLRNLDWKLV